MEKHSVNDTETNETDQSDMNEWSYDYTKGSNNDEYPVQGLSDTAKNNVGIEKQENNCDFADSRNSQNNWANQFESKNQYDYRDKSGFRRGRGRGGFNKPNYGHNSFERTSNYHDSTSNYLPSNGGHVRGHGRGRGFVQRFSQENESYAGGYSNEEGYNSSGHRGFGRANNRGMGGRSRGGNSSDSWHGNTEEGYRRKENDRPPGPKPLYIPPDFEKNEFIGGIEAGLNFDKYETIEVKVSGIDPPERMSSFHDSGLQDILLENLSQCNFSTPTPIQNYAIPIIIGGRDLMASAQTGSGKTVCLFIL